MRHTILLADDSPTIQRLVNQTFADTPFDIVTVNNGDAAVRKFDEIEPDVVLADIYMPGKNGYEVCTHVKAHASLSETPVILLVGAFDAFDEATANQAGATAHITKPFEPRALIDLVTSTLPEGGKPRSSASKARSAKAEEAAVVAAPEPKQPEPAVSAESSVVTESMTGTESKAHSSEETVVEVAAAKPAELVESGDLLGLENLFPPQVPAAPVNVVTHLTDAEIDKIADRVIRKLSTQVIESVAWDVVPDIAVKVLRDELKKTN